MSRHPHPKTVVVVTVVWVVVVAVRRARVVFIVVERPAPRLRPGTYGAHNTAAFGRPRRPAEPGRRFQYTPFPRIVQTKRSKLYHSHKGGNDKSV